MKKGVKVAMENVCQSNQHVDARVVESIFDLAVGARCDFDTSKLKLCHDVRASQAKRRPQFSYVCANQVVGSLIDSFHSSKFIEKNRKKFPKWKQM